MIWVLPNNKHTWAFYYFCRRKGDRVNIISQDKKAITLEIVKCIRKES